MRPILPLAVCFMSLLLSCSSSEEPPPSLPQWCSESSCPVDLTGVDLSSPPVSFEADIMGAASGIFRLSCNLPVCHGQADTARAGLYLGPPLNDTSVVVDMALKQSIINTLLGPSKTAPALSMVTPGNPDASFMMLKLDGCHNDRGLVCSVQEGSECGFACGDPMPPGGALSPAERHLIRRWIFQGAQNN